MQHTKKIVMAVIALSLTGCDEQARDFAKKTRELLKTRGKMLDSRLERERKAYLTIAKAQTDTERTIVFTELTNERTERSTILAAEYTNGGKPTYRWRQDIGEFRKLDFEARIGLLTAEIDQTAKALEALEELRAEKTQTKALDAALAALEKKKTPLQEAMFLAEFAKETKSSYDESVCKKALEESKKGDEENKANWKQFLEDKGCKAE